jgi:hypothetical protein
VTARVVSPTGSPLPDDPPLLPAAEAGVDEDELPPPPAFDEPPTPVVFVPCDETVELVLWCTPEPEPAPLLVSFCAAPAAPCCVTPPDVGDAEAAGAAATAGVPEASCLSPLFWLTSWAPSPASTSALAAAAAFTQPPDAGSA